jgi:hypothetical protein
MADIYKVAAKADLTMQEVEHAVRAAQRTMVGGREATGSGNLLRVDLLRDETKVFLEATASLAAQVANELGGAEVEATYEGSSIDEVNAVP